MADINWVQIGVGFVIGVFATYSVRDIVFGLKEIE